MPQLFLNVLIINYTKATVKQYRREYWKTVHEDEEWQKIISSVQLGDLVEIVLSIGPQFHVTKITAYLIFQPFL